MSKVSYEEFFKLYKKKLSDRKIAEKLGASSSLIGLIRRRYGLPKNPPPPQPQKKIVDKEFFKLYGKGFSDKEIAKILGVAPSTVGDYRRRRNLPKVPLVLTRKIGYAKDVYKRMKKSQKFTDEQFLKLYNKGYSDARIAAKLKVAASTVHKRRVYLGLAANYKKPPYVVWNKKFSEEEFLELYNKGLDDREIAKRLKVSRASVRVRRWKLGLKPNGILNML
ncbi:MAG: hypothetical protein QME47_08035, partial [Candidatus Thermoplasmatota archaeon]|nr:hypothetical protein [Candidatus Thermoplasmatota archaeon]